MTEKVFVTGDLSLALAMTVVGFAIRSVENTVNAKGEEGFCFELDDMHNGVEASDLRNAFYDNGRNLASQVDAVIEARGITRDEYVLIAFDAARAALKNRKPIIYALQHNKPLIAKQLKDGRSVIYRHGTPKEQIKILVENA